jgi:uncharacterized protein
MIHLTPADYRRMPWANGRRGDGLVLRADPLIPVAFPGDVGISAQGVSAPCEDVNVMTARSMPRPVVTVEHSGAVPDGEGLLLLLALAPARVNGVNAGLHDLIQTVGRAVLEGGPLLAIRLFV